MNKKFYESKVTYKRFDQETLKDVKVKETFVIEAATYGDAETKTYELLEEIRASGYDEPAIKPIKLLDVINNTDENTTDDVNPWFKLKVVMSVIDSDKPVKGQMLVKASSLENAIKVVRDTFKGSTDVVPNGVLSTDVYIVMTQKS